MVKKEKPTKKKSLKGTRRRMTIRMTQPKLVICTMHTFSAEFTHAVNRALFAFELQLVPLFVGIDNIWLNFKRDFGRVSAFLMSHKWRTNI